MAIRTGTATTAVGAPGTVSFDRPFKNGVDAIVAMWSGPDVPPTPFLIACTPTANGFSYPAVGGSQIGTISYIAFGH